MDRKFELIKELNKLIIEDLVNTSREKSSKDLDVDGELVVQGRYRTSNYFLKKTERGRWISTLETPVLNHAYLDKKGDSFSELSVLLTPKIVDRECYYLRDDLSPVLEVIDAQAHSPIKTYLTVSMVLKDSATREEAESKCLEAIDKIIDAISKCGPRP